MLACLSLIFARPLQAQTPVQAQAYRVVNIRSGPGTQYPTIDQLNSGDTVVITGRNDEESNWLQIEREGQTGWIAFFTVSITGDLSSLPIITDIAVSTTQNNPVEEAVAQSPDIPAAQIQAFRSVNVRTRPTITSPRLGVLDAGASANITGKTADSEWLQIDFQGQEGWIAFFVVDATGNLDSVPVVIPTTPQPPPQVEVSPEAGFEVMLRFNANLRRTPTRSAELIRVLPYNARPRAIARTESADWLLVEFDGETGWVVTSLVNIAPDTDIIQLPINGS